MAKAPRRKYLRAASFERGRRRVNPASTYTGMLITSRPRNTVTRSVAPAIVIIPATAHRMST